MEIYPFLPAPLGFRCADVRIDPESVTLGLIPAAPEAACPACGRPSHRVHSRYTRTLADLPWAGMPVRLRLRVRRFFCDTPHCSQRTFSERLANVAAAHSRKTFRLTQVLCRIGLAVGGEAGINFITTGRPTCWW